jgi:hypothetical protein
MKFWLRGHFAACIVGTALFVFGIHLWIVANFGTATPYWDQWDAVANSILRPYLDGTLSWSKFFAAHNEHRLAFQRLIALILFIFRGVWDPMLEMTFNAAIHAAAAGMAVYALGRRMDRIVQSALALSFAVLFSLPFAWENVLWGFQSVWYLNILLTLSAIVLLIACRPFSPLWFAGIVVGIAPFFCMASGALTLIPIAATIILRAVAIRRKDWGASDTASIAVMALSAVTMLFFVPTMPGQAVLGAHSVSQFLGALTTMASWPLPAFYMSAVLLYMPPVLVTLSALRDRAAPDDPRWVVVALFGWLWVQYALLAYGRAFDPAASRYLDVFVLATVVGVASLARLLTRLSSSIAVMAPLAAVWVFAVSASLFNQATTTAATGVMNRYQQGLAQTANVRSYLQTGNDADLNKPALQIPYPQGDVLASRLKDPLIRSTLPPSLLPDNDAPTGRFLRDTSSRIARTLEWRLLAFGWLAAPFGLSILLCVAIAAAATRRPGTASVVDHR